MLTKVTPTAREKFVTDNGFIILAYSGRMKDSPPQIKHIMRDAVQGWYAVNLDTRSVYGPFATFDEPNGEAASWRQAFYRILFAKLQDIGVEITNAADGWYFQTINKSGWLGISKVKMDNGPYAAVEFAIEEAAEVYGLLAGYASWSNGFVPTQERLSVNPISVRSGAYGLYSPSGELVATVMHDVENDLGQPAHDAVLFANALLLLEFVAALQNYTGTLSEVQAEASKIVDHITGDYGDYAVRGNQPFRR